MMTETDRRISEFLKTLTAREERTYAARFAHWLVTTRNDALAVDEAEPSRVGVRRERAHALREHVRGLVAAGVQRAG